MSEENDIQEEEKPINYENPADQHQLKENRINNPSETEVSTTKTTTAMEVHHHGHVHHQSKWKEYIFQFLMLFLAVFCGFLAEYQLEHYIEKERSEELAKTLFEELKSDSVTLHASVNNRINKEEHLRYVANYFKDSNMTVLPKAFYPRFTWALFMTTYVLFEPKDGILEQLKNSGSLRYFRNIEIQKAVGDFSVAVNNLRIRSEREASLSSTINRDFIIKHYDNQFIDKITNNGKKNNIESLKDYELSTNIIPASILHSKEIDREGVANYFIYYAVVIRSTRQGQMHAYEVASTKLMKLLREDYHLK